MISSDAGTSKPGEACKTRQPDSFGHVRPRLVKFLGVLIRGFQGSSTILFIRAVKAE